MGKMTTEQRKLIFGLANTLGIYKRGAEQDDLHALVYQVTGKEHISELDENDAANVVMALKGYGGTPHFQYPNRFHNVPQSGNMHRAGMITPEEVKKVWALMYSLAAYDVECREVTLGHRLAGIIAKDLHLSAHEKDPFRFIDTDSAYRLIEILKKMVSNEKRKAQRRKADDAK